MRPFEGKTDALILDYGSNAARHGPIDAIVLRLPGDGEPPARECPRCGLVSPTAVPVCPGCGFEFPPPGPRGSPKVRTRSDDVVVLRGLALADVERLAPLLVDRFRRAVSGAWARRGGALQAKEARAGRGK